MNAVIITKVRNSADVIESFIRHHAPIAGRFVIILHRSTDETHLILKRLINSGFQIEIRWDDREEHNHARAINEVLDRVRESTPSYIIPLDSDEFIVGWESLAQQLPEDHSAILYLPWRTYVPTQSDDMSICLPYRIEYYREIELKQYYKVCIPGKALQQIKGVTEGNHNVRFLNSANVQKLYSQSTYIAHFPVRTPQQILEKIKLHWQARLANPQRKPRQSAHIKKLYDKFSNYSEISREDIHE
ncbi:glycosyltransferase family 2 protein [uncultured Rubinisphaera sp.]|uniref:glycosyltransferase family 2 protein n=1 Tax=uncultured Rubinisphaera sp. TaxID=1678686 RepID=UPI0030DAF951